jgi:hypothetical protein
MRRSILLSFAVVVGALTAAAMPAHAGHLSSGEAARLLHAAVAGPAALPTDSPVPTPRPVFSLRLPPDVFLPRDASPDTDRATAASPTPSLFAGLTMLAQQTAAGGGAAQAGVPTPHAVTSQTTTADAQKASFMKVLQYSVQLIFYEHVMRVAAQPFTRAELKGPFWRDYIRSVKMPTQWGDGDSWEVNYIGHSLHGSAGVRLWLAQREPDYIGKGNKHYWKSIGRAFLFGTLFSLQFEIGPLSEASIGNVGLHEGRSGWVDHVVTPIGSVLWTMYEDTVDKYVLTWIDKHVPFVIAKAAARMILCPAWMLANVGMNRVPWDRPGRPITFGK